MTEYRHEITAEESSRIQRFLYIAAAGTAAFGLLLLIAFLTLDRWVLFISHEAERRFVDRYIWLAKEKILEPGDPALQDYVENLAQEIADQMDLPNGIRIRLHVIKGSMPNAFATLGGHIFVLEGLIRTLDSENALAMVLAHEMAHCVSRDPLRSAGRGMLLEIAVSSVGGSNLRSLAMAEEQMVLNAYSREMEQAADKHALILLQAQFGHVGGATRLFEFVRDSGLAGDVPEILSTHPAITQRIGTIKALADENGWRGGPATPYPEDVRAALSSKP